MTGVSALSVWPSFACRLAATLRHLGRLMEEEKKKTRTSSFCSANDTLSLPAFTARVLEVLLVWFGGFGVLCKRRKRLLSPNKGPKWECSLVSRYQSLWLDCFPFRKMDVAAVKNLEGETSYVYLALGIAVCVYTTLQWAVCGDTQVIWLLLLSITFVLSLARAVPFFLITHKTI